MQAKMSNNGEGLLSSPLTTGSTTLNLQAGHGARFKALSAGEWMPLTIIDSAGNFEIVKATARTGDSFTIVRAQEGTTARAFSAGDRVQNRLTAAVLDEIDSDIAGLSAKIDSDIAGLSAKADAVSASTQKQLYTAFTSAGAAPSFTLTPTPALTVYAADQRFRCKFHAAGNGADTLNVSGLGAKSLKQYDASGEKVAAVIAANQLADVEYDGVDFVILDPLPGASATQNNTFSKAQRGAVKTLTDEATIAINLALANNYSITLAGSRTLGTPTNAVAGQSGIIAVTQDATGSRLLAFGADWKFAGGVVPVLSTTAGAVDYLAYYVETPTRVYVSRVRDVK